MMLETCGANIIIYFRVLLRDGAEALYPEGPAVFPMAGTECAGALFLGLICLDKNTFFSSAVINAVA